MAPIFLYSSLVQFIASGYERAVAGIHILPVQGDCAEGLIVCLGRHIYILSYSYCASPTDGGGDEVLNRWFVFLFAVPGLTFGAMRDFVSTFLVVLLAFIVHRNGALPTTA